MVEVTLDSKAGSYSTALKRGLWERSGDLEFTLTPSLCFLKWFSHFSISELSGQTDRHPRFSMDRHEQQTCRDTCAERWPHPWLALPPPLHTIGEEIEVATLPLSQKRVPELQHVAVHDTVLSQGVICTHTQTGLEARQRISSAFSPHSCFQSPSLYLPRGPAVCSLPSCVPRSCPCPSWRPHRRSLPPPVASAPIWPGGSSCTAPGRCLTTTRQRNGEKAPLKSKPGLWIEKVSQTATTTGLYYRV